MWHATKQVSINLRRLKSYRVSFPTTQYETRNSLQEENWKNTNTWRLNNMLLNNRWINREIEEEIKQYIEANENGNTTFQNL